MGNHLRAPITDKESTDESSDKLICGASSMQGWRLSQEDAHNCILDYDTDTAFFAVYDGHGGHEVAEYCAKKLPDFIKNTDEYKEGKIEDALINGFLKFDALIATPEILEVLKEMARGNEAQESEDEENVNNLYEEAAMPIEQVIEKYTSSLNAGNKEVQSSFLRTKKDSDSAVGTSSGASSSGSSREACGDGVSSSSEAETSKNGEDNNSEAETATKAEDPAPSEKKDEAPIQNGEVSTPVTKSDVTSSSTPVENGTPSKKGKGKAVIKPEPVKTPPNTRPKRNAQQLYKNWLQLEEEDSDNTDEEDQTFEEPKEESSDDEEEGVNIAVDVSESSEDGEDDDDDDDDEEDDEDDDEGVGASPFFALDRPEGPGLDSGCTAVVAVLKGNELYVANAGDSRCIVCRKGKAIEMSFDHKPEDEPELTRIKKAGDKVTREGRVNGGLNLSRAIGDHSYKLNKELSDREQSITSLPDVKTLTINPAEDEFIFLACDGIWNSLSSQEVVDFIRPRLLEGREKLSQICEEIFDHCLAPNIIVDAIGCDNMTGVLVTFKTSNKRAATPEPAGSEAKRAKTDAQEQIDTPA